VRIAVRLSDTQIRMLTALAWKHGGRHPRVPNWQTAGVLERHGLVRVGEPDPWKRVPVRLTPTGWLLARAARKV
jgi:hypothetical protein